MGVQLTKEQMEAVTNRGGSLLVSAAAGSGKTKVLVERLFHYITDPETRADVTDFLIITYTKAAAAELRMKIASELSERLAEDPDNQHLQKQVLLVYRADVRTVDSFCTNLLRENAQRLPEDDSGHALTPDFRVLDENEAEILRLKALECVMEQFYETIGSNEGALLLADTIGAGRDDSALQDLVLQIYGKLQSHAYPGQWIEAQKNSWEKVPEKMEDTPYGRELMQECRETLHYWIECFSRVISDMERDEVLSQKYLPCFAVAKDSMEQYLALMDQGWDEAGSGSFEFQRLGSVRGENELKVRAKALWDQCKKDCEKIRQQFSATNADMREDMEHMAPAMLALLDLIQAFSEEYAREKLRKNATDFSDQEHFALELLVQEDGTPTEIGRAVSGRYREIMIDEFQDTNEVQNKIFSAVSREEKNLFMVGDMKQSIYRFRLADPTIFLHHYENDPMYDAAEEGQERKLLLSRNFRSRREILSAANFVCGNLMSPQVGEMRYSEQEALYFGAEYYQEKDGCETEFYLVDHHDSSGNEDQESMKCAEVEARFAAHRIRALLDEPYLVQREDGTLRPVREEDIVILLRSPGARQKMYERVLAEQGIRCATETNDDFFSAMEIAVVCSMLQVIDNPHQDVPLISVLRSPVFAFTANDLALIRAGSQKGDFYDALEESDSDMAREFLRDLNDLRFLAPDMSVHRLIWHLYNRWNILGVFGAMDDGDKRRKNLIALYEHAQNFEAAGYKGLFQFVSHLRALLETGEGLQAAPSGGGQGVRLMSIHKSKGLEFPVVILSELNKQFNKQDVLPPILMHPELGLGPTCVDLKRKIRYHTVAKDAVIHRLTREQKSEEMRVLYVALTRAKEKLILISAMRNAASAVKKLLPRSSCPAAPEVVGGCSSMAQWILLPLLCRTEAYPLRQAADMEALSPCNEGLPWKVEFVSGEPYAKRQKRRLFDEADEKKKLPFDGSLLEFQYPYLQEVSMPSKLTATQIKGRMIDQRVAEGAAAPAPYQEHKVFAEPLFLQGERRLTAAERGTAMHMMMQFLDFSQVSSPEALEAEMKRIAEKHLLRPEQMEAVDQKKILALFASPLGQEMRSVPKDRIWREYRFSVLDPASRYAEGITSEDQILLQGAVDCFFETEEGLVVVDFKTDRIRPGREAERAEEYRVQLDTYSQVLERIFEQKVCRKVLYFFATDTACEL